MPRDLSDAFREAFWAPETDKVAIVLLDISHPDIDGTVIRLALNTQAVTSNGNTYSPFPFEIQLPEDTAGIAPRAMLRIDNVDRSIALVLRSLPSAPTAQISVVLADTPNRIEIQTPPLTWRSTSIDAHTVEGVLEGPSILNTSYPMEDFTPGTFPNLFLNQ